MPKTSKVSSQSTSEPLKETAKKESTKPVLSVIKDIERQSRKQYSVEEKIRIVLEGLRGEVSVAEICRREGINPNIYYRLSLEQRVFRSG
jgi:transposase